MRTVSFPVKVDIHEHAALEKGFLPPGDPAVMLFPELVEIMDRKRIERSVILPLVSPETINVTGQCVEALFRACDEYPGRFIKFCNVDPRQCYNRLSADFTPLLEYFKSIGAKGLGEVTANLWFHDPRVHNLLRACEKAELPFLFHLSAYEFNSYGLIVQPGMPELEDALRRYPALQFLGHSMAFWAEVAPRPGVDARLGYPKGPVAPGGRVPELMRKYTNLWGDLSAGSGCNALARDPEWGYAFVNEFQDRLLVGFDMVSASNDACPLIGFLEEGHAAGKIADNVMRKLLGGNAIRLLKLE